MADVRLSIAAMLLFAAPGALAAPFPEFDAEPLKSGRGVWLGTCKDCHANPDSDAPQVGNRDAWKPRLAKGAPALYRSALVGHTGADGIEMPPRGGNKAPTDAEVKSAVDYMMTIASQP